MQLIIFIIHVVAAASLIALVLLQHGKGADAGAAFGSGASQTMFGSTGSMPFLTKITAIIAAVFFATSLGLGYLTAKQVKQQDGAMALPLTAEQQQGAPSVPAPETVPMTTAPTSAVTPVTPALEVTQATASTTPGENTPAKATVAKKAQTTKITKTIKSAKKTVK